MKIVTKTPQKSLDTGLLRYRPKEPDFLRFKNDLRFEFPEILDAEGNFLGFDIVIGNPPYIPLEQMEDSVRIYYRNKFEQVERKYDTSVLFFLEAFRLLSSKGTLAFIAPITWQTGGNYAKFREFALFEFGLEYIINLQFNTFENAYVETAIYGFTSSRRDAYNIYNYEKKTTTQELEKVEFEMIRNVRLTAPEYRIVLSNKAQDFTERFSSLGFVRLGEITKSTQGLSGSRFPIAQINEGDYIFPYLGAGNVHNYQLVIEELHKTDMSDKKNLIRFYEQQEKVLIRRLVNRQDRLSVGFTDQRLVFKKDINPFIPTNTDFSAKYLLSILASRFISYFYVRTSTIATKDDFRQTTLTELRNLPIPKISTHEQAPFIALVDRILELKKSGGHTAELENRIDEMVYELYDLTPDEIAIVEGK